MITLRCSRFLCVQKKKKKSTQLIKRNRRRKQRFVKRNQFGDLTVTSDITVTDEVYELYINLALSLSLSLSLSSREEVHAEKTMFGVQPTRGR